MREEWKSQSDVNMQYFVINSYHSPVHCFRYYNFIVSIIFHRKQKRQKFPRKIISFGRGFPPSRKGCRSTINRSRHIQSVPSAENKVNMRNDKMFNLFGHKTQNNEF